MKTLTTFLFVPFACWLAQLYLALGERRSRRQALAFFVHGNARTSPEIPMSNRLESTRAFRGFNPAEGQRFR
jgi:hypothetical protein